MGKPLLRRGTLDLAATVARPCAVRILLASILLLCAGCGDVARPARLVGAPDGVLVVFADGFHSGVILSRHEAPGELLPPHERRDWAAFHFGVRDWITGAAGGPVDAMLLAVHPGPGGMQVDGLDWWVHDRGGTERSRLRVWAFPVSAGELAGARACLRAWVEPGAQAEALRPGSCWWPVVHDWSLRNNCHDFTAAVLHAAGIDVARPWIMQAGGLRDALDAAWALRDDAMVR